MPPHFSSTFRGRSSGGFSMNETSAFSRITVLPAKEHFAPRGNVYQPPHSPSAAQTDVPLRKTVEFLHYLLPQTTTLNGHFAEVQSTGFVRHPDGALLPIPTATAGHYGDFCFQSRRGGVSAARNERAGGRYWLKIIEASQFGQVNAYYHITRLASYVDKLLQGLGESSLPKVRVLVGAHSGYNPNTGTFSQDDVLAGGHYRVAARSYQPAEPLNMMPTGEIHLGPGKYYVKWGNHPIHRTRRWQGKPYFHQPSHNPAIVYHEYGHHIVRHTADFRGNTQRQPHRQSNVKNWFDEGICDYFVAVMLGHPFIYEWHRGNLAPTDHRYRNLEPGRTLKMFDSSPTADPHYNGTIWATFLWRLRTTFIEVEGWQPQYVDQVILHALLRIGRSGEMNPTFAKKTRRATIRHRSDLHNVLDHFQSVLRDYGYRWDVASLIW